MKRVYLLLVILLTLSACEQTNTSTDQDDTAVAVRDIDVKDAKNIQIPKNTKGNSTKNASDFVAEDKSVLSAEDFETAYQMCAQALSEYYKAIWNGTDIDLDTYIDNENLKQYTQNKITSQYGLFRKNKLTYNQVTAVDIDAEKADFYERDQRFFYFKLNAHVKKDLGNFAEPTEFLVQNLNGKLVIVDWYTGAKDSYDSTVRGENQIIDNPDIWDELGMGKSIY
ncbi:hypothetical protein DET54_101339 [Paenibacillus pabuli]|uniref:Lipoprotein n=1 Tax=Paenibacillus pabuli TaxID=1472 RepID=A0ABX9BSK2_9BACL|nr:hypothetical protein [Paenibacillus pabuli]RAJ03144.1 hypothetical protein DET54_101339 [Paenibacillus pabuli]